MRRAVEPVGQVCSYRPAPLAAAALRVARDRPFRACGRSPHRPRPFRAKMNLVSTPAGKRGGLRGVAAHPPRFLRWPLAPGGSARGAGWGHLIQAREAAAVASVTATTIRTHRDVLQGPRIVPTPRLIVDYARNGHLSHDAARTLLTTISPHRSWENSPYVTQLLHRLDE